MPYDSHKPATSKIADAAGRLLFSTIIKREIDGGAAETVAFARAWAALSRLGWEEAGGVFKRLHGPNLADQQAIRRVDDLCRRADVLLAKAYTASQPRDSHGRWTVSGFGGTAAAGGVLAPQLGTKPDPFMVKEPTAPTRVEDNENADDLAVYVDGVDPGEGLNGVPFEPWHDAPTTDAGWANVAGQNDIGEPPFPEVEGLRPGSGVVIEEPDGRVWVVEPTNHFGGYEHSFPKGGLEDGLSAQANAIKETFEESGLKVEITGYLGDYERTTSVARYYTARRVGGSPAAHGEESQSVKLVPKADLLDFASHKADAPIIADFLGFSKAYARARGAWSRIAKDKGYNAKQPRAPIGSPIGGQWVSGWGGGGMGVALANAGQKFEAVALTGKNMAHSSIVSGNAMGALMTAKANAGDAVWFAKMEALGKAPKPAKQTYAKKTYANWVEAKAYAQAKVKKGTTAGSAGLPEPKATKPGEPSVKLSSLEYAAPKPGGSAEGAIYKDANGQKWLVKAYKEPGQAQQEVLASSLYKAAGAGAPDMMLVDTEGKWPGKSTVGVMSKWEDETWKLDPKSASAHHARADFAADVWLGNWDAVGQDYDNIRLKNGPDGVSAMRIDPGGALEYRAMGDKKGAAWNGVASEWDSLRDPGTNPQSAAIFGAMTSAEMAESAAKVAKVSDADIKAIVAKHLPEGEAAKMADTLIARRDSVVKQSGIDVDHAKAPEALHKAPQGFSVHDYADPEIISLGAAMDAENASLLISQKMMAGDTAGAWKALDSAVNNFSSTNTDAGDASASVLKKWGASEIAKWEAYHKKASPPDATKAAAAADSPAGGKMPDPPSYAGSSASFYAKKSEALTEALSSGDMEAATALASYAPKGNSAKKSDNFLAFKAHADAAMAAAAAKGDAVPAHLGPKSVPPKVKATTTTTAPDGPGLVAATSTATSAPPPSKGVVTSAANAGQQVKFDAIHEMGTKGDVDGLMAMSYGTNTYGKQQANKANEWLVHHGYAPAVFGGMNGKNDPKAGTYAASALVGNATPKPAASQASSLKAKGGNPKPPPFKPENISDAPDFQKMGSSGGPLSSVPTINLANNEAVALVNAAGKKGDLAALKAMTFPEIDKEKTAATGALVHTGKQLPLSEHPSSHVKAYFNEVVNEVDNQLNPPRLPTLGEIIPGAQFDPFKDLPPVPSGKAIGAVPSNQKAGAYVVLGKVEQPWPVVPKVDNSGVASAQFTKKAKAQWESLTGQEQNYSYSYVGSGSGWMNTMLQEGKTSADLTKAVTSIKKASVDIPEGATFIRNMGEKGYNKKASPAVIKKLEQQLLQAEPGTIFQEPAFSSTSWTGTKAEVLADNNIQWRFTAGPGVKAVPLFASINAGEGEALLLPNQRYMIMGAKKKGKTVVVDAVLLPTLD